jgi:hypothetical protein
VDEYHCSFCGKGRSQVRKLISGPRVFICDECVNLCRGILGPPPPEPAPEPPAPDAPGPAPELPEALRRAQGIWTNLWLGAIDAATAAAQMEDLFGLPFTDLDEIEIPDEVLRLVPTSVARDYHVIPVARAGTRLTVAMLLPGDVAIAAVRDATHLEIDCTLAFSEAIQRRLERHYAPPLAPPEPAHPKEGPHCSFCGKAMTAVANLIAGPAPTYICNECVVLCENIIAEEIAKSTDLDEA